MTAQSEPSRDAVKVAAAVVEKYEDNASQDEVAMIATALDAFAAAAVEAEKEQCAAMIENIDPRYPVDDSFTIDWDAAVKECASTIRSRSSQSKAVGDVE